MADDGDLGRTLRYVQGVMGDEVVEGFEEYVAGAPDESLALLLFRYGEESENPYETLGATRLEHTDLKSTIIAAARRYQLPPALIDAVIRTESGYRPQAVSRTGAKGLMQLMPRTAAAMGVDDPFDPRQNIYGGTRYLRKLVDAFEGKFHLALAAYNAGPGNVRKYKGVPPFKETQRYVKTVLRRYEYSPMRGEKYRRDDNDLFEMLE